MAKIKTIILSDEERAALDKAWRQGKTHDYRQRCQMLLLKSQTKTSKEVAKQLGCCEVIVNKKSSSITGWRAIASTVSTV